MPLYKLHLLHKGVKRIVCGIAGVDMTLKKDEVNVLTNFHRFFTLFHSCRNNLYTGGSGFSQTGKQQYSCLSKQSRQIRIRFMGFAYVYPIEKITAKEKGALGI